MTSRLDRRVGAIRLHISFLPPLHSSTRRARVTISNSNARRRVPLPKNLSPGTPPPLTRARVSPSRDMRVGLSRARRDGGRVRASVCRRARSRGKLPETPARAARGRGPFGLLGLLRDYDYGDGRGVSTNESAAWVGTAKARATPARRGRRENTGAREARLAASTLDANLFEDETSRPAR